MASRLFTLLERYHSATEAVAYPLPQGYNSFLAYLAHRCLPHSVFMQYVRRGVLQLNVDVLREIVYGEFIQSEEQMKAVMLGDKKNNDAVSDNCGTPAEVKQVTCTRKQESSCSFATFSSTSSYS